VGSCLKLFKKGKHYTVDVEILKRALRELVEREPAFFRDLFLDALRSTAAPPTPFWSCSLNIQRLG
jgi:hypothetical protein